MNVSSKNKYLITIGSPSCDLLLPDRRLENVRTDIQRVEKLLLNAEQGYTKALPELYIGATSDIIKNMLTSWFTSTERSKSDCVIIYYAGHADGSTEPNSHYLYTVESNPSNLPNTVIKTSDLVDLLFPGNQNSPQNILLILDVCYAGQGAANALVTSLTQRTNAIQNIHFCIIASADSKTEAEDGGFVEAFEKVMKESDDWMSKQGEFLHPGDLVAHINEFLVKKSGQKAEFNVLQQSKELTFFRNPRYSSSTQRKSREQIIADCLLSLDYCQQKGVFIDAMIDAEQKERAFLVQTDEEEIQSWLVRRLAKCVSGFQNAKKYEIRVRRHRMRIEFNYFFEEFQQDIGIGNEINNETVIQGLANICEQKSVVIAIYGLSRLDQEKVHQFHAFWSDLVTQVHGRNSDHSRLVLLLAEENENNVLNKLCPFQFSDPPSIHEPIHLKPLESLLRTDVEKWQLKEQDVYDLLNFSNKEKESIEHEDVQTWSEKPLEMLENICCKLFKIDQGIAAIERYWKLTG